MKRCYIEIMVQDSDEVGGEFGDRIQTRLGYIMDNCKHIQGVPNVEFTSCQNGRQTANIGYITEEPTEEIRPADWIGEKEHWDEVASQASIFTYNFWPDLRESLMKEYKITKQ